MYRALAISEAGFFMFRCFLYCLSLQQGFKFFILTVKCLFVRFADTSTNEQVPALLYDSDFEDNTELRSIESFILKDILKKLKKDEKKWQEVVNGKHCVVVIVVNINVVVVVVSGVEISCYTPAMNLQNLKKIQFCLILFPGSDTL